MGGGSKKGGGTPNVNVQPSPYEKAMADIAKDYYNQTSPIRGYFLQDWGSFLRPSGGVGYPAYYGGGYGAGGGSAASPNLGNTLYSGQSVGTPPGIVSSSPSLLTGTPGGFQTKPETLNWGDNMSRTPPGTYPSQMFQDFTQANFQGVPKGEIPAATMSQYQNWPAYTSGIQYAGIYDPTYQEYLKGIESNPALRNEGIVNYKSPTGAEVYNIGGQLYTYGQNGYQPFTGTGTGNIWGSPATEGGAWTPYQYTPGGGTGGTPGGGTPGGGGGGTPGGGGGNTGVGRYGGYDPYRLPGYAPIYQLSRQGLESQFGQAQQNILSQLPRGGALAEGLTNLNIGRAIQAGSLPATIATDLIQDIMNKSYGAAFGAPSTTLGGLGSAASSYAGRYGSAMAGTSAANAQAANAMGGIGQGLGGLIGMGMKAAGK